MNASYRAPSIASHENTAHAPPFREMVEGGAKMRSFGRWLRRNPDRSPMLLTVFSSLGLASIVVDALFGGPPGWETAWPVESFLILLDLAYPMGGSR